MAYFWRALLCLAAITVAVRPVAGSNAGAAHFHAGKLRPYDGSKIMLSLAPEEEQKLETFGVVSIGYYFTI
jgi:hypothetical protein